MIYFYGTANGLSQPRIIMEAMYIHIWAGICS